MTLIRKTLKQIQEENELSKKIKDRYDEDIDYSDIPELTDEDFGNITWINYNEQSFYHWWMLPLRMNIKLWLKYINNEDVCFWQSLSGEVNRQEQYFGYKFN